jgi:hypothetical protein
MSDILSELLQGGEDVHPLAKVAEKLYTKSCQLFDDERLPLAYMPALRVELWSRGRYGSRACLNAGFASCLVWDGARWFVKRDIPPQREFYREPFGASYLWLEGERPKELKSRKQPRRLDTYRAELWSFAGLVKPEQARHDRNVTYRSVGSGWMRDCYSWEGELTPRFTCQTCQREFPCGPKEHRGLLGSTCVPCYRASLPAPAPYNFRCSLCGEDFPKDRAEYRNISSAIAKKNPLCISCHAEIKRGLRK